jgi:hypothetical protein
MSLRYFSALPFLLFAGALLTGCASSRQLAIDHPEFKPQPFHPLPGFKGIDGDDYYVRLISEFDFKGDNILKSGCTERAPSYEKNVSSAALIYNLRNDSLKFKGEAAGFLYQAASGKCNFTFDAKKLYLTPWIRLDTGKQTMVDYNFYTNANSDLDVSALVGDVNAASGLLALTGVGMGVAVMGQIAGHWVDSSQQTQYAPTPPQPAKHSSESHSLPALASYSGTAGTLNQAVFKVYEIVEGGLSISGPETRQIGELKIFPEITSTLLLKTSSDGTPDARDLSLEELGELPIKSAAGDIRLQQLIEQSKHPSRPNLKPDWNNYNEVETHCRNLKRVMKDLGFNKFDRNALLYYFLAKSSDWKNYNINRQKALNDDLPPKVMKAFRGKDFGNCLAEDDYGVMKLMALPVNTPADWDQIGQSSEKKEQLFTPLKSIERQLLAVLKNTHVTEMERQLYPLLTTAKEGEGSVLLQNHLGNFGLEKLLNPTGQPAVLPETAAPAATALPVQPPTPVKKAAADESASDGKGVSSEPSADAVKEVPDAARITTEPPAIKEIPGEGVIVSAHQLAQVVSGLLIDELSCARLIPGQQSNPISNIGILLFTTREGSPRAKGGAMEFEFTGGKITRIAFQLPTYRDFAQDVMDRPEVGGCRIDAPFLSKLH